MTFQRLTSLRGRHVALTGNCGQPRPELVRAIRRMGGSATDSGAVTSNTTVFVRGESDNFKFGEYGAKEARIASLIRGGSEIAVVTSYQFERFLRTRGSVPCDEYIAGEAIQELREEGVARRASADVGRKRRPLAKIARDLVRDRKVTTYARAEQAVLRAALLTGRGRAKCALCGEEYPSGLLVAGHIKPRARCSAKERADLESIAMLVCLFGCDALYERGLLSVAKNGKILVSERLESVRSVKGLVARCRGRRCAAFGEANAKYFEWHRNNRYDR